MAIDFFNPISLRDDVREQLKVFFSKHLSSDMVVYDVGCGDKPFAPFLKNRIAQHIGVDIEDGFYHKDHIDLIGTASCIPAKAGYADAVISSQVFEHLDAPLDSLKEANRILKKGGLLFLAFPFMYPMHALPHDYGRYTEFFIEKELEKNGFDIVEYEKIGGFWYCAGLFSSLYLQNFDRGIFKKLKITAAIIWLSKLFFRLMHEVESFFLNISKKDSRSFRTMWTVNYVYVCKKT